MSCDIVLTGVGGQGVLAIGDLLLRAAFEADLPATFYPTKGIAQRGGFVKAEIRLGRTSLATRGPRIGDRSAELVVGLERSESLKGLRFLRPEGTFILFDHVWPPTGVMLGKDRYPTRDEVIERVREARGRPIVLEPTCLPIVDGRPVSANVYVLGAMLGAASLGEELCAEGVERVVVARWPRAAESNRKAFRSGLAATKEGR